MRKYTFIVLLLLCLPLLSIGQSPLSLGITGYNALCNGSTGGSAKVTPSGGVPPYSYTWAPMAGTTDSVSGLAAGIYSVTVTDSNGRVISGSVTISQPAPLVVSIDSIVTEPCFRTTGGLVCGSSNTLWAVVSGGTPPYAYLWSPGGGTDDTLYGAGYTEYNVTVTDSNNCITTDSINVVDPGSHIIIVTSGVSQVNAGVVSTYPNPANTRLNIGLAQSATNTGDISVYDMPGRVVLQQKLNVGESLITLDVSGLAEGNYLLKITSDDMQSVIKFSVAR